MSKYSYNRSTYKPRSLRKRESKTQKSLIRNVVIGIIVIFVLLNWGLPALVGGLSFFNKFKPIPKNQSLTNTDTLAPPVLNIPFDATNSGTLRISGYANPSQTVKIYIDDELKTTTATDDTGNFQTDPVSLDIGTNDIYGKVVDNNAQESLPSKTIKLTYNSDKPNLTLNGPSDNTQIHGGDKKVTVSGSTDPDDTITVNGTMVVVNQDGSFSTTININDGDNNVVTIATNSFGNTTVITRKVTYSSS